MEDINSQARRLCHRMKPGKRQDRALCLLMGGGVNIVNK